MKKRIVVLSSAVLTSLILGLTGCSKDDTTSPVVTLNGNSTEDVILNSTFSDPGATANDDEDGAITVSTSGTVDVDHTGDYTLTYSATDAAGNVGQASRVVHVYNQAELFEGTYNNSVDTCQVGGPSAFNPAPTVTVSDSLNKHIWISNFGAFGSSVKVEAVITDNAANAPVTVANNQSLGGNAYIQNTAPYQSSSYVNSAASASTAFQIKYQWNDGTNSDICTSHYIR
jgi:hypothetical protein